MAASISSTLLITLKPYLRSRKANPKWCPTTSHRKRSAIIASSSPSFKNGSPPETECPVPWDQQPVNEYQALSTSFPFSWAAADLRDYCSRLALIGSSFAILVGLPVAAFGTGAVSNTSTDVLLCGLGAASTGIIAVTLAVLRMYLGWAYVGNRLLSATVEYEETGWYDGQFTLVGLAISLAVCVIIFINVESPKKIPDNTRVKVIAGVYNDEAAKSFEPDAFHREPDLS